MPIKDSWKSSRPTSEVPKIATTEFCQGKTMRWGIAWTYDESIDFPKSHFQPERKEKPPLSYTIPQNLPDLTYDVCSIQKYIENLLQLLKIHYVIKNSSQRMTTISILARENTWSNQRRKRRQILCEDHIEKCDVTNSNEDAETKNLGQCKTNQIKERKLRDTGYSSSATSSSQGLNYGAETKNKEHSCQLSTDQKLLLFENQNLCNAEENQRNVNSHSVNNSGDKQLLNKSDDFHKNKKQKTSLTSVNAKIQNREGLEQNESNKNNSNLLLLSNNLESKIVSSNESEKITLQAIHTEQQGAEEHISCAVNSDGDKQVGTGKHMKPFTVKFEEATDHIDLEQVQTANADSPESNNILLKSQMTIIQRTQNIVLELTYEAGQNYEYMHQIMQYFKNRLKPHETTEPAAELCSLTDEVSIATIT